MAGCASKYVSTKTVGPEIYAVGEVAEISDEVTVVTTQNPDGTVTVVTTSKSVKSVQTESSTEHKENMAKINGKTAVGIANAGQVKVTPVITTGGYGYSGGYWGSSGGTTFRSGGSWRDANGTWHLEGGSVYTIPPGR